MSRTLLRLFGPPLLAAAYLLPLSAQTLPGPVPSAAPGPAAAPSGTNQETAERGAPVLQTAVAFVCTVIVMLIVCVPSRKS